MKMAIAFLIVTFSACLAVSLSQSVIPDPCKPYMLVATTYGIMKINMTDTRYKSYLRLESGIEAIDYHYRRELLFWVNKNRGTLKFATLTNNTERINNEEITGVDAPQMKDPTGVTVDWINDRVYWIEQSRKVIRVYDMNTKEVSLVLNLPVSSAILKLKVLPQSGILLWGDRSGQGIQKISLNGSRNSTKIIDTPCPDSMALNYRTGYVYLIDACTGAFLMNSIDGSNEETVADRITDSSVSAVTMYSNEMYWTATTLDSTADVEYTLMESGKKGKYFTQRGIVHFTDVAIVHPSNQPTESEMVPDDLCDCLHGNCSEDGLCICQTGWTGSDCSEDVDECEIDNGGCESACENFIGTYLCTTAESEATALSTSTSPPTPSLPPKSSTLPAIATLVINTNPPATTAPPSLPTTVTPSTTKIPPASTSIIPTTRAPPSSTTVLPTTAAIPSTATSNTINLKESPSTNEVQATQSIETTTINESTQKSTTVVAQSDNTESDIATASERKQDETTLKELSLLNDENLDKAREELSHDELIITIVASIVGCIILVVVVLYAVFLYIKCKSRRSGFYNVYKRHSMTCNVRTPSRRQSEHEPGTESVHSSFRDISQRSNISSSPEQFFGGFAELGHAGPARDREEETSAAASNIPVSEYKGDHCNLPARPLVSAATNPMYMDNDVRVAL